jgi:hypothetical protein
MSDLTSCYFCGTALDAPVERYPLTPPSIDATTGRSVALCPTCRRKLVKVLEIVGEEFDAVLDEEGAPADDTADAETTEAADAAAATDSTADADDADADTTPAAEGGSDSATETTATDADADSATETTATDAESTAETVVAEEPAEDAETAESTDESDTETDEAAATGSDSDEHEATADAPTADESGADPSTERSKSTDVDPVAATDPTAGDAAGNTASETAQETADAGGAGGGGKPELLSTPAAQKVIKLLQNREFPLEREEFEIVASNAYDIPMRDCEEVIDTLVGEGYVDEDGAMLTRPE